MSKPSKKACKSGCKADFCHSSKKDAAPADKKPANDTKAPKAPKQGCGCKSTGCCKP